MKYFITGCAGFVGSNLTDRLQADGHTVTGYDNFSSGKNEFTTPAPKSPGFTVVSDDTLDLLAVTQAIPTPEDAPFPVQISLYGASKLAGAGLIQADCESNDFQG